MKIAVVAGGPSNEAEISLMSAKNICDSLTKLGYDYFLIDPQQADFFDRLNESNFVFNIIHGEIGEDGKLQGLLDLMKKEYTCSDLYDCNATFDKYIFYEMTKESVRSPKTILVKEICEPPFSYPFIIKPRRSGSSKGVHIIHDETEYNKYMEQELAVFGEMLVQEYLKGREMTISFLQKGKEYIRLPYLELKPLNEFYDYEAKYTDGKTEFIVPAPVTSEENDDIIEQCAQVLKKFNLKDIFRIDGILSDGKFYVIEANTVPGMTKLSDLPMSANAAGISFDEIIDTIIKNHIR